MCNQKRYVFLLSVLISPHCATTQEVPPVSFPPQTTLVTASAYCSAPGTCACRPLESNDQREEGILAGHKRFEFRLPRTPSALWVQIEGKGVFYKPAEQSRETCFYVDLPAGEHRLVVHGEKREAEVGLQTGLKILEYGAKEGPHWYRSLDYVCGGLSTCAKEGMISWVEFQRSLPRGVLDPCGSTMIRNVTFQGIRPERLQLAYESLTLRLSMKIYEFETYRPPGSPACTAPVKNR